MRSLNSCESSYAMDATVCVTGRIDTVGKSCFGDPACVVAKSQHPSATVMPSQPLSTPVVAVSSGDADARNLAKTPPCDLHHSLLAAMFSQASVAEEY